MTSNGYCAVDQKSAFSSWHPGPFGGRSRPRCRFRHAAHCRSDEPQDADGADQFLTSLKSRFVGGILIAQPPPRARYLGAVTACDDPHAAIDAGRAGRGARPVRHGATVAGRRSTPRGSRATPHSLTFSKKIERSALYCNGLLLATCAPPTNQSNLLNLLDKSLRMLDRSPIRSSILHIKRLLVGLFSFPQTFPYAVGYWPVSTPSGLL
jgi:hypothetical protein